MTTKTWNFTLEGQPHTLTLEHGVFSGKRDIILDGQLLEHISSNLMDSGSVHEYEVDGHSVVVVIQSKVASFAYDLLVDGISIDSGQRGSQRVGNTTMQGTLVLVVIMLVFGLVMSWVIKSSYDEDFIAQEWPVITGEVIGRDWDHHPGTEDSSGYYHAVLQVAYSVGDARYTAQFDDDQHFGTREEALAVVNPGEKRELYVNPANPQQARLFFEKLDPYVWVGPALIAMGMMTGLAILVLAAVWFQTRNSVPVLEGQ